MNYARLIWRNLGRNKLRTGLTGSAIALAVALVCLLLTMPAGFDRILESATQNTRVGIHAKAGLVYSLPLSYLQKVRALPGVVAATSYDWFGGVVDVSKGVEFPSFAVDREAVGTVFSDYGIEAAELENFSRNRDGALVGEGLLERYHWKLGDRITLESTRYGFPLEFQVLGLVRHAGGNGPPFFFHREYLEEALQARGDPIGQISMIWARIDEAGRVEPLMREVDEMFRTSEVQTASETEKGFVSYFIGALRGMLTVILLVTGVVALCVVFIAANTVSMSVRERMRELAIYKALGFSRRAIFATLLGESMLLSTVAGLVGVGLSQALTGFARSMANWNNQYGAFGGFVVSPAILLQGMALALAVGLLAGIVPSLGAARRSVLATLREVF